jgi:hypothetical protein
VNSKDKTWGKYGKLSEDEFKHHWKCCEEHRKKSGKPNDFSTPPAPFPRLPGIKDLPFPNTQKKGCDM